MVSASSCGNTTDRKHRRLAAVAGQRVYVSNRPSQGYRESLNGFHARTNESRCWMNCAKSWESHTCPVVQNKSGHADKSKRVSAPTFVINARYEFDMFARKDSYVEQNAIKLRIMGSRSHAPELLPITRWARVIGLRLFGCFPCYGGNNVKTRLGFERGTKAQVQNGGTCLHTLMLSRRLLKSETCHG